jgi:hypothetical protein
MKKYVFIKVYGWLEILQTNGNYALLRSKKGGKFTYNILGLEVKQIESESQQNLFS